MKGVEGVVLRSLWVGQVQVVHQLGVEGGVLEQGGLDPVGILGEVRNLLDLDLDHTLPADHLGEVGHTPREAHILQVDLDQAGNFLAGEHNLQERPQEGERSLQVGGLLVGLALIVNWEGEVGVAASQDWAQDLDLDDQKVVRWQVLGLARRLVRDH